MKISIISFTQNGIQLSQKIMRCFEQYNVEIFTKCSKKCEEEMFVKISLEEWTKLQMQQKNALIFIGACGIAVRAIAPYVKDKLSDAPVLVVDELGHYVIPILAGHVGGANLLAYELAKKLQAQAVITTATDINHQFAVDLFAKKNHLEIGNKDGIAKISAKILAGEMIQISVDQNRIQEGSILPKQVEVVPYPPQEFVDVVITEDDVAFPTALVLRMKSYIVGMGCRKGKEKEKLRAFLEQELEENQISIHQVSKIVSVEQKKKEPGLISMAEEKEIPFITYTAEELQEVEGEFSSSHFVEQTIGIDNVCERAAQRACNGEGTLILKKHAKDGMTIAVAKKEWRITFDEA